MAVSANRLELLQIADAVAREKSIDRGIVIAAMEDAIQKAARSRYGSETEVRAEINPKTGEMRLSRLLLVVDLVENPSNQISLESARRLNPRAQVGDTRLGVVPLVRSQCVWVEPTFARLIDQLWHHIPLGRASGLRQLEVDQQPVVVSMSACPAYARRASLPRPFFASSASGSVVL